MSTIKSFKNQHDFNAINSNGKRFHSSAFLVVLSVALPPSAALSESAGSVAMQNTLWYGIKVGKKFSKKAVLRNKARRKIKHMLHEIMRQKNICKDIKSILIVPKQNFHQIKFADMLGSLEKICCRFVRDM